MRVAEKMIIRPYESVDQDSVIELWTETGLVVAHNDPLKDIVRKLQFDADLFLVGISEKRVIATVMAGYEGHRGWINYLAVDPLKQGCGIGRTIMREAEKELALRGCPKINLQIRRGNTQVIKFYTALGYLEDDVISMGKRIDNDQLV